MFMCMCVRVFVFMFGRGGNKTSSPSTYFCENPARSSMSKAPTSSASCVSFSTHPSMSATQSLIALVSSLICLAAFRVAAMALSLSFFSWRSREVRCAWPTSSGSG